MDGPQLVLPCEDAAEWARVQAILRRPLPSLGALDDVLTEFAAGTTQQTCRFFTSVPASTLPEAAAFDFDAFWRAGVPLMLQVALEMPVLFAGVRVPLLLRGKAGKVALSRRQCACLLSHSVLGSITAFARPVEQEKWAFRASQLFFLEALPSALCVLNYFKTLGEEGVPSGEVVFERCVFSPGHPPWEWDGNPARLCPVTFVPDGAIEESGASRHADFANKFIGGGALENDFHMEEILFAIKPELIVSMALCSYMQDEEAIRVSGALQYAIYTGFASTFEFAGDYDAERRRQDVVSAGAGGSRPPVVCAMDALQGCARVQFGEGLVLRDMNKARIAFDGASSVATGNWGCGAFGNDHVLKFLQQWLAASEAGVEQLHYHTFRDPSSTALPSLAKRLGPALSVGHLWAILRAVAKQSAMQCVPEQREKFHRLVEQAAAEVEAGTAPDQVAAGLSQVEPAAEAVDSSLVGATVFCDGVEMLCVTQRDEQVRLKRPDGKMVWRPIEALGKLDDNRHS